MVREGRPILRPMDEMAGRVERAVEQVLDTGIRTADIHSPGTQKVSTEAMGDAVVKALRSA